MSKKSVFSFIKNNKKKCALLSALAVCLGVYTAVGGNFPGKAASEDVPLSVEKPKKSADESALVTSDDVSELENTDTYFQELRATLDMDRSKILSMLEDAESSASTKAEKDKASAEKMRLLDYMEQEKTIEALIKNKGLPETMVVITDSGVNITVNSKELDQAMVTKICEIVMRQTDRPASEIVVQDAS